MTSFRAAAAAVAHSVEAVRLSKRLNCPAFRGSRIYVDELRQWLVANADVIAREMENPHSLEAARLAIACETARRLKMRNDLEAGLLVRRAWVVERFQVLGGELRSILDRSVQSDAMRFAAAQGDPAKCRTVLKVIWHDVLEAANRAGEHLRDEPDSRP